MKLASRLEPWPHLTFASDLPTNGEQICLLEIGLDTPIVLPALALGRAAVYSEKKERKGPSPQETAPPTVPMWASYGRYLVAAGYFLEVMLCSFLSVNLNR
jgi:hypothetical protein